MNKKNFPIFISLFIVSLFFTVIFYYGYRSLRANYGYYMASSFYHGEIKDCLLYTSDAADDSPPV